MKLFILKNKYLIFFLLSILFCSFTWAIDYDYIEKGKRFYLKSSSCEKLKVIKDDLCTWRSDIEYQKFKSNSDTCEGKDSDSYLLEITDCVPGFVKETNGRDFPFSNCFGTTLYLKGIKSELMSASPSEMHNWTTSYGSFCRNLPQGTKLIPGDIIFSPGHAFIYISHNLAFSKNGETGFYYFGPSAPILEGYIGKDVANDHLALENKVPEGSNIYFRCDGMQVKKIQENFLANLELPDAKKWGIDSESESLVVTWTIRRTMLPISNIRELVKKIVSKSNNQIDVYQSLTIALIEYIRNVDPKLSISTELQNVIQLATNEFGSSMEVIVGVLYHLNNLNFLSDKELKEGLELTHFIWSLEFNKNQIIGEFVCSYKDFADFDSRENIEIMYNEILSVKDKNKVGFPSCYSSLEERMLKH